MGNINIKGSKLGNGTVIIGGNIKNSSIEGNSVSIINNKIFVDGKEIETEEKVINIIVEGNLDKLEVDCCNSSPPFLSIYMSLKFLVQRLF